MATQCRCCTHKYIYTHFWSPQSRRCAGLGLAAQNSMNKENINKIYTHAYGWQVVDSLALDCLRILKPRRAQVTII
jgi:hypothetical protein